jgi:anti-anti-sigma factor
MDILTVTPLENGTPGFRLVGELDMSTAPIFAEALAQVDPDAPLTLDLSELTFIDSTGVQAIFAHALSTERKLVLDCPSPEIMRTLEILGISRHSQLDVRPAATAG